MNIRKISLLGLVAASLTLGSCSSTLAGLDRRNAGGAESTPIATAPQDVVLDRPDYTDETKFDQRVVKALDAISHHSYNADLNYSVLVEHPNSPSYVIDTFITDEMEYSYYYGEDGERATASGGSTTYGDWDRTNQQPIPGRYNTTSIPVSVYWRDPESGMSITENRDYDNTVSSFIAANMDEITGEVVPVIFDSEFDNPWDFVDYEDFSHVEGEDANKYHLALNKAEFFAQAYGSTGMNTVTDAIVTLGDDGRISKLELLTETLSGGTSEEDVTYTRSNTYTIDYTYEDRTAELFTHKTPYEENRNPELQSVFDRFATALATEQSYRYDKKMVWTSSLELDEDDPSLDGKTGMTGFFTADNIYFRQWGPNTDSYTDDGAFYNNGDNYDYGAVRQADGTYLGYECTTDGEGMEPSVSWGPIVVSTSALYTFENYAQIGPTFNLMDADIFNKGDDGWYTLDDELLARSGGFFDFSFLGVHSTNLEDSTESFRLKLEKDADKENDYTLTVETTFSMMDLSYTVTFTFDTASIGTTDLPGFCYTQEGTPFKKAQ